jgi:uncharacterized protein YaeQ
MDRNYYQQHQLTIARHPSENDQRMMLRIVAFIQNASEHLEFTKGLSEVDDPDLWQKNLTDDIELWIELGQPSEQRIKKGCNASQQMIVYSYQDNAFDVWWDKEKNKLAMRKNLNVYTLAPELADLLANAVDRHMNIQVTIQDGTSWLTINESAVELTVEKLL